VTQAKRTKGSNKKKNKETSQPRQIINKGQKGLRKNRQKKLTGGPKTIKLKTSRNGPKKKAHEMAEENALEKKSLHTKKNKELFFVQGKKKDATG